MTVLDLAQIQMRRGTAAAWALANPVLLQGEPGMETDTGVIKVGDGTTAWAGLLQGVVAKSLVTAKGDLVGASAGSTPARVPVGASGTVLVSDPSQALGLSWMALTFAGKNVFLNSGFAIAQRGTSQVSTGYGPADRWWSQIFGTATVSQDATVPAGVPVPYSLKLLTAAAASYAQFWQSLAREDVILLRGRVMTPSWYMQANAGWSNTFGPVVQYSNVSDSNVGDTTAVAVTIGAAGQTPGLSWARYTATFTVPADAVGLQIQWDPGLAQASGAGLWFAAPQLEVGAVATPYARNGANFAEELAACLRYAYQPIVNTYWAGYADSTTVAAIIINFPVTMRTIPTAILNATGFTVRRTGGVTIASTAASAAILSPTSCLLAVTVAGGLVAGESLAVSIATATSIFSADL
jgi:hypothetical protein